MTAAVNYDRHSLTSLADAEDLAAILSKSEGKLYVGVDQGKWTYPRYDVVSVPQVGDKVSYAFNGDYYPCGEVVSVSKSNRVVTTTGGRRFYRRKLTAAWIEGGTWSLVPGHISRRNPSF